MHNLLNICILVFVLLNSFLLKAQEVTISGKATDYSSKEISFYTIPDPLLNQKLVLGTTKVGIDGSFSFKFPVNQVIEIYSDLEKYCGTMVVEPGKKYTVVLPPFSLRTLDEAKSAYFKPAPYWLGLPGTDNNDLNLKVRSFITDFNAETLKSTSAIYKMGSKETVNLIIQLLEKKYPDNSDIYFKTLKQYAYAELEYAVNQNNTEFVIQKYFAKKPLRLHHPAYQKVFALIFTDYLRKLSQDSRYMKLVNTINLGDYKSLVAFFENRGYLKEFAELVVLKGLDDGYYSGKFRKDGILKAIETAQSTTTSTKLRSFASRVGTKLTIMSVGSVAPPFKLVNLKNEQVSLEKYKGKFTYLSFINSRSSDSRTELDSLASIEKEFRQILCVVSIALDEDFNRAVQLWKSKGYPWELLDGSKQKQLVTDYNASVSPSFYLIAPDMKFILSPALSPIRGFEPLFLKIYRDYTFKQQRKAPKEPLKF
jgi:hypothetical protein